MKNDYIVRNLYRSFVIVSILTALTATVGMLIDNIIVGQALGQDELGAMGVVGPISLIFSAFGNICSGGGTARASQAIGRGDRKQVCRIFTVTMWFALLSGVVLTIVGLLFTPQIAGLLGAKEKLIEPTEQYLYGYFIGAIPTILMTALMGFVRIDGSPKLPLVCIGVMTGANILLDLLMALVLKQGMFGMALATSISYFLAVLVGCTHFMRKYNTLKLAIPKRIGKELVSTVTTGAPTALSRICETMKAILLNNLLGVIVGVGAVTAFNVRTQANNILGALMVGIGQAAIPVVGMFFGEEDRTALKDTIKTTLRIGLLLNCVVAVVLLIYPSIFSTIFGVTDPDTAGMADTAVRLFALGMPISLLNTILMNFYQCTKKTGLATLICVLQGLVYTVLMALLLIYPLGSTGVWLAFFIGEILTLATIVVWVTCRNRRFSIKLDTYLLLKEDWGGDPKDRLELSIGNSMEEVMRISSGIHKFGRGREIDEKTLNRLALFIEEMAGNIVQHGFKPGEKKWFDLMILDKPDRIVIRMRDNGPIFDPTAYLNNNGQTETETESHFGIKMVSSLARKFEYRRGMGLNTLIMVLDKQGLEPTDSQIS